MAAKRQLWAWGSVVAGPPLMIFLCAIVLNSFQPPNTDLNFSASTAVGLIVMSVFVGALLILPTAIGIVVADLVMRRIRAPFRILNIVVGAVLTSLLLGFPLGVVALKFDGGARGEPALTEHLPFVWGTIGVVAALSLPFHVLYWAIRGPVVKVGDAG